MGQIDPVTAHLDSSLTCAKINISGSNSAWETYASVTFTIRLGASAPMRARIYARYSSDSQREASIEDQIRRCRARIEREGWIETEVFTDYAISGATAQRPGFKALLDTARTGHADVVVAEALDRISRDQEHIAGFYKELSFAGVQIVTLSEGDISELHVGLKGTMNALFLKDLGQKTHRGMEGRIRPVKAPAA